MHSVNRQAIVKHTDEQMFELVNAIETYPDFLNWCHDSHLIAKTEDSMIAGMTVSLAGIKQKFTTKNVLLKLDNGYKIELSLVNGPFNHLAGFWQFTHLNQQASKIELHLEFDFKSGLLNSAFSKAFGRIVQQLVVDFVSRANHVYC